MIVYQQNLFPDLASDYDFILDDRVQKIKAINEEYDIEKSGYVSFSGGFDSVILSRLIDIALPNNKIPRVFCNTGLEYKLTVQFIKELAAVDDRITVILPRYSVKKCFEDFGYPFKSKYHSHILHTFQLGGMGKSVRKYIHRDDGSQWACPAVLQYQFSEGVPFKVSERCCYKLKKQPFGRYEKESGRYICLTGMRRAEKGLRNGIACTVFSDGKLKKFHPLAPCDNEFMAWFKVKYNVPLSPLYFPPYNFNRTGCVGCPYNVNLRRELECLKERLPDEYRRACGLFGTVYKEMEKIHYRGF